MKKEQSQRETYPKNPLNEVEEAEVTAMLQEYHAIKEKDRKERGSLVSVEEYDREKNAKNQAYAFILSNGLYEDYVKFTRLMEGQVEDWQEYNLIASYVLTKEKEGKEDNQTKTKEDE